MKQVKILAIESSCDETAAAVASGLPVKILSSVVASQIKLHQKFGGVYPEMASRAHAEKIIPVINRAVSNRAISNRAKKYFDDIDVIAVTAGPGLIGSLLVGVNAAKTLAYALKKPLIPVNHIEGHIYANFVSENPPPSRLLKKGLRPLLSVRATAGQPLAENPQFPLIALTVAGGHTALILMRRHLDYQILGETLDDAAGEAFDKVARLLNLGYPGGPAIEAAASKLSTNNRQLTTKLLRPMIDSDDFNFSFSGLKTAVLKIVKTKKFNKPALAGEFQEAVSDVLTTKTLKAAQKYQAKSVLLGGGVAANQNLREKLEHQIKKYTDAQIFIPQLSLCTD
ncbi:tRNA (adenosine(37)-N6)-threonylcarbamoyltransferase complex transferase subunit TsaD, partial [Candidatus Berkelbacteria bacterium]|nr:tRNA (adenosine(37)-N6)-threonylcarbamoyltransferase complex transferase subunit TsaD [Candidatus Berkelbacteria bacterium]